MLEKFSIYLSAAVFVIPYLVAVGILLWIFRKQTFKQELKIIGKFASALYGICLIIVKLVLHAIVMVIILVVIATGIISIMTYLYFQLKASQKDND